MARVGLLVLLFSFLATTWAAEEIVSFDTPEQKALYNNLLKEYRCLKCQNQNLAGSKASLAGDLRREIRDQILAGGDKKDIDTYLISRYGDFVLYGPPFSAKTALLWIGPFAILLIALMSVFVMIKRQRSRVLSDQYTVEESDDGQRARLEKAKRILREKN